MTKKAEISAGQLAVLIFLSRVFTLLNYSTEKESSAQGSNMFLALAISAVLYMVFLIPIFQLLKKRRDYGIIEWSYWVKPWFGKAVAGISLVLLVLMTANTVSHFELFLTASIYPQASSFVIILLFVLGVAYGVYMGLEACARMGGFVFAGVIAGTVFLFLCLLEQADFLYLTNPLDTGIEPVLLYGWQGAAASLELITVVMIIPMVRGNLVKASGATSAMVLTYYELITLFALITLGEYARSQLFPVYSMTAVAEFSVMQRLDSLFMAMWVFIAFVRTTYFYYLAVHTLGYLLPRPIASRGVPIIGLAILPLSWFLSENMTAMRGVRWFLASGIPVVILVLIVPGIVLFTARKKEAAQ